jgi:hypothetical protein
MTMADKMVTNQNLVVPTGGGHQKHYPIWQGDGGIEYISLNGQTFVVLSTSGLANNKRETVTR